MDGGCESKTDQGRRAMGLAQSVNEERVICQSVCKSGYVLVCCPECFVLFFRAVIWGQGPAVFINKLSFISTLIHTHRMFICITIPLGLSFLTRHRLMKVTGGQQRHYSIEYSARSRVCVCSRSVIKKKRENKEELWKVIRVRNCRIRCE